MWNLKKAEFIEIESRMMVVRGWEGEWLPEAGRVHGEMLVEVYKLPAIR